MRRYVFPGIVGVAGLLVLTFALALPVAAARGQMWSGSTGSGSPATLEQARERAIAYLDDSGLNDLAVGEVMEFSNHFYVAIVNPTTGDGAFELLVSRDGSGVHPEPTMMWNTEYNPMLGGRGAALHRGMMGGTMMGGTMSGGMMSGGMGAGMMGAGATDRQGTMDPSHCGGMMGSTPTPGTPLDQPLTIEEAATVAQGWLDANRPGTTASEPIAFPGYATLHIERDGQIVGMLSVQTTSGAVWEHSWHGDFIAIEHDA